MDIDEILTFLAIQETGSISRAADKQFVSQATVSQRLKMLENEVGASLYTRQRGKTSKLTEKGKLFAPIANRWLALYQETKLIKKASVAPLLSIGCSDSLVTYLFGDLFAQISQNNHDLDLKLRIKNSSEIYAAIDSRVLDIGLLLHPINDNHVITEKIATEKMVLIKYGKDIYCRDSVPVEALDKRKEIQMWWGKNFQTWHDTLFSTLIRSNISVNTISLMLPLLRKDGAWAVIPFSIARKLALQNEFCIYNLLPPPPNRDIYMVTHRDSTPMAVEMITFFRQQLNDYLQIFPWILRI